MNNSLQKILVVVGPTASGKTALALEIAKHIPSEIISADSRQVYTYLTIGTAKPSTEERALVPHHFIDSHLPDEHFNAGEFGVQGRKIADEIIQHGKLPIVVGGTGLYIRSLLDGLFEGPSRIEEIRQQLELRLHNEGVEILLEELRRVDPIAADRMLPSNTRRIIRALEVFYLTGKSISEHHAEQERKKFFDATVVGLHWKRAMLYDRINKRVDTMIAAGFIHEVQSVVSMGYDDRYKSMQTVGYKEALAYLRNEISYERMIELMKQNTRRFAKRQMTWFRYEKRIQWFDISNDTHIALIAKKILKIFE